MEYEEIIVTKYIPTEKDHLKEFIRVWETCPELWDTSSTAYRDKAKKNLSLIKLLAIYKNIKPASTTEDVKKKLNSLRTNFRKELKKVYQSKTSGEGINEVYTPSSWTYFELLFLAKDEQLVQRQDDVESNINVRIQDHQRYAKSSMDSSAMPSIIPKKKNHSIDKKPAVERASFIGKTENVLNSNTIGEEEYHIAKVWASKLQKLSTSQKMLAENAINNILFDAEMGNLVKTSTKINELCTPANNKTADTINSNESMTSSSDPCLIQRKKTSDSTSKAQMIKYGPFEEIDGEHYFGLSIIPTLKQMSDDQKLTAKLRILEVLQEVRKTNTRSNIVYMDEASTEYTAKEEYLEDDSDTN